MDIKYLAVFAYAIRVRDMVRCEEALEVQKETATALKAQLADIEQRLRTEEGEVHACRGRLQTIEELWKKSEFFDEGLDPANRVAIEQALETFLGLGASVREVSLPNLALSVPAYYVVAPAECSSNLSRFEDLVV